MAQDSTPPLRLNDRTNVRLPFYMLVGLMAVCCGGAIAWANLRSQVEEIPALKARLEAHDAALARINVMANDISWIKDRIAEQRTVTTTTITRQSPPSER